MHNNKVDVFQFHIIVICPVIVSAVTPIAYTHVRVILLPSMQDRS